MRVDRKGTTMARLSSTLREVTLSFLLAVTTLTFTGGPAVQNASADAGAGGHNHGLISCGRDWTIAVSGAQAQRNGSPGPGGTSRVFYRAVLYQWNGKDWVAATASAWQLQWPFGYGVANFDSVSFDIYKPGYFAAKTEFYWFDYRNQIFYGATDGWASGGAYCTYR